MVKFWPKFHSLDDIAPNRAVFWVQAHGHPQNLCTFKTGRYLGGKIGAVLEVEDPSESGRLGHYRGCPLRDVSRSSGKNRFSDNLRAKSIRHNSTLIFPVRVKAKSMSRTNERHWRP
ncbi:hypothetical protein ACFX12_039945 [Malus domestica]